MVEPPGSSEHRWSAAADGGHDGGVARRRGSAKMRRRKSHPFELSGFLAAEQVQIAAGNHSEAVPHKPYGRVAKGRGFPWL